MKRSLRTLSLILLLAFSLLATGCCFMGRHHHGPCAQKCQTPCPDAPCKQAATPAVLEPAATPPVETPVK